MKKHFFHSLSILDDVPENSHEELIPLMENFVFGRSRTIPKKIREYLTEEWQKDILVEVQALIQSEGFNSFEQVEAWAAEEKAKMRVWLEEQQAQMGREDEE